MIAATIRITAASEVPKRAICRHLAQRASGDVDMDDLVAAHLVNLDCPRVHSAMIGEAHQILRLARRKNYRCASLHRAKMMPLGTNIFESAVVRPAGWSAANGTRFRPVP